MDYSTTVRKLQRDEVQGFLRGDLTVEELNASETNGNGYSYPRYGTDEKVIVVWCLVIANPEAFDFTLAGSQLVGPIPATLNTIFPENRKSLSQNSFALHLHAATRPGSKDRCLTLPRELIEAVRGHIGNPDGGIAKYFRERGLEVPTGLDSTVAEAALAKAPTEETRKAKSQLKAQQRAKRREHLKTTTAEAFLSGQLSFSELMSVTQEGVTVLDRAYSVPEKVIVVWCLIIARPKTFGFRHEHEKLIGTAGPVFKQILSPEHDTVSTSLSMGLHKRSGRYVQVTLPRTLVELVQQHIGNPDGGIAKYFRERKLEVPTGLDSAVAEAALAPEYKPETLVSEVRTELPEDARSNTDMRSSSSPDPDVLEAAEKLHKQLRKVHTPEVLSALRRLL